jgi:hypothetical protein
MSRTLQGMSHEPSLRTDSDTPDPDERNRKKVRWNSDGLVEEDKEGDSEESIHDDKVGSPSIHVNFPCHLTTVCRRLVRRFV